MAPQPLEEQPLKNMKTFTQQQVLDRYDRLPEVVKDALFSEATSNKMMEIGKENGLMIDQVGTLAQETGYVMVGLVSPQEYPSRLSSTLGIDAGKASTIATSVNEQVFKPIREHLLKPAEEKTEQKPSFIPEQTPKKINTENREQQRVPPPPETPQPQSPKKEPVMVFPGKATEKGPMPHAPLYNAQKTEIQTPDKQKASFASGIPETPAPQPEKSYIQGADPYREIVE